MKKEIDGTHESSQKNGRSNARGIFLALACSLACLRTPPDAAAAFRNSAWGARPEGMGGAFVAVADDANATLHNPAGSALVPGNELSFAYAKPFVGLGSEVDIGTLFASYTRSLKRHSGYGFAWTNLSSDRLKENTFLLNASVNAGRILGGNGLDLIFGANVKRMSTSFDLDARSAGDPVFRSGDGKSVFSFDFGAWSVPLPRRLPRLSFGLALKNVTQPDAGLRTEDSVPLETVGGLAYGLWDGLVTFEASKRRGVTTYRGGGEYWLFDGRTGGRFGASSANGSLGFSYRQPFNANFILMDYAFIMPFFVQESAGTHRISFSFKFGNAPRKTASLLRKYQTESKWQSLSDQATLP